MSKNKKHKQEDIKESIERIVCLLKLCLYLFPEETIDVLDEIKGKMKKDGKKEEAEKLNNFKNDVGDKK